jgi:hypothetical protein
MFGVNFTFYCLFNFTGRCICVIVNRAISMELFNSLYVYEWDSLTSDYVHNTCSFVTEKQGRYHQINRTNKHLPNYTKKTRNGRALDYAYLIFTLFLTSLFLSPYSTPHSPIYLISFPYLSFPPPFIPLLFFIHLSTSYLYLILIPHSFFSVVCIKLSCEVSRWQS